MRCLLIGTGSIGRRHIRCLRELEQEVTVIALRSGKGGHVPDGLVDVEVRTIEDALSLKPDCAIIANPAPWHAGYAASLLDAGLAVFIEKPIATVRAEAEILRDAAGRNGKAVVGYVLRHDPGFSAFATACRSEVVGQVYSAQFECGQALEDWRPQIDPATSISARRETGGGVLFELSHEIDAARCVLGDLECTHAVAKRCGRIVKDVEDLAIIFLQAASGIPATVHIDMLRRPSMRQYCAFGTQGTLIWNATEGYVAVNRANEWEELYRIPPDRDDLYRRQMRHFLSVVREEAEPICSVDDGFATLEVVLQARQAAGLEADNS